MHYDLLQATFPMLTITLNKGEQIYAQSGALCWMDRAVKMCTNMKGGLFRAIGRKVSGTSMFLVTFSAPLENLQIGFSTKFIGSIIPVELFGQDILVQKNGFLCAESGIVISTAFVKRLSAGLFGGEGFILQKVSGQGICFLEGSGNIYTKNLAPEEIIYVDTGNLLAFESRVEYSIKVLQGVRNVLFGGEGAFLAKLKGPGTVLLQTLTAQDIANRILELRNRKNKHS